VSPHADRARPLPQVAPSSTTNHRRRSPEHSEQPAASDAPERSRSDAAHQNTSERRRTQIGERPFREPTNRSIDSIGQQLVSTLSNSRDYRSRSLENNVSWENPIIELDFLFDAPLRAIPMFRITCRTSKVYERSEHAGTPLSF
jgi:hypothetical protein